MFRPFLALALICLVGTAPSALASFVYLEADFDGKTVGQALGRGGAEMGEPVAGAHDTPTDEVVNVGPGNNAVRVEDSDSFGGSADFLNFTLADSRQLSSGVITFSFDLTPEIQDVYEMQILGTGVDIYFGIEFDAAGFLYWRDDDTPAVTFDTYTVGTTYSIEVIYDIDDYTYTFNMNGVNILTDEPSGIATGSIEGMAIGNGFDGNMTGSCLIDNVRAFYRPGESNVILMAGFNKPLGPVGTGGAEQNEPVEVDPGAIATVENTNPIHNGKYLSIADDDIGNAAKVTFKFLDEVEMTQGSVCITYVISFDQLDTYQVLVYQRDNSNQRFMELKFLNSGEIQVADEASVPTTYLGGTYTPNTPIRITYSFEMDYGLSSLWIDGDLVLYKRAHGITDEGVGQIIFGSPPTATTPASCTSTDCRCTTAQRHTGRADPTGGRQQAALGLAQPLQPAHQHPLRTGRGRAR